MLACDTTPFHAFNHVNLPLAHVLFNFSHIRLAPGESLPLCGNGRERSSFAGNGDKLFHQFLPLFPAGFLAVCRVVYNGENDRVTAGLWRDDKDRGNCPVLSFSSFFFRRIPGHGWKANPGGRFPAGFSAVLARGETGYVVWLLSVSCRFACRLRFLFINIIDPTGTTVFPPRRFLSRLFS